MVSTLPDPIDPDLALHGVRFRREERRERHVFLKLVVPPRGHRDAQQREGRMTMIPTFISDQARDFL
jgi:hypothetical protein